MSPIQAVQLIKQILESTPLNGQDRDASREALHLLATRSDELDKYKNSEKVELAGKLKE